MVIQSKATKLKTTQKLSGRFLQRGSIATFGWDLSYRFDCKELNVYLRIYIFIECLLDYMFYNFKTSTTSQMKHEKGVNVSISLKNTVGPVTFTKTEMHFFSGNHRTSSKLTKRCPVENAVMPG